MTDFEIKRLCAEAIGWKHLGAVGVVLPPEVQVPSEADALFKGKLWCLSGQNDWWEDPEGHTICGPCQGSPDPLHDDAQAMALGKKYPDEFKAAVEEWAWQLSRGETGFDLNYCFCGRVAKMQLAKEGK